MLKKFAIVFCLVALSVPVAASAQSTLSVGQRVKTTANVNVRSKPTNAKKNVLCIRTTGSVGTIVGGPTVATGYTWWNVNFDSKCDGWAVQNHLVPDDVMPPPRLPPAPTADLEAVPTFNQDTAQQFTLFVQRTGIQPSGGHRQRERSAIGGGRQLLQAKAWHPRFQYDPHQLQRRSDMDR